MDRPRRSTRPPTRLIDALTSSPPVVPPAPRPKRKTQDALDPADRLHLLLTSPKSSLTSMDISALINTSSWNMLSEESQRILKLLLPPTAFVDFCATIGEDHPSAAATVSDAMEVDQDVGACSSGELTKELKVDPATFTDSHFLAAAHTLQDHIYSDWMSDLHLQKVKKYEEGIRSGELAAPWKDDAWERDNENPHPVVKNNGSSGAGVSQSNARAGEAAEIKLIDLAKNNVLRAGDIIAFKRNFAGFDLVVEKDAIIESIHPKTHVLTVLFEPGTSKYLPSYLLSPEPSEPSPPTQVVSISSPTQLETALLDNDGRVEKTRRPHGNAWKSMTVWRWRDSMPPVADLGDGRWGRERDGTLFYLRGTYYHER